MDDLQYCHIPIEVKQVWVSVSAIYMRENYVAKSERCDVEKFTLPGYRTDWVIIITLLFTLVANLLYILVSWVSKAATASAPQTEYLLATNFFQKTNPEHHNNVNFNMIFALTICLDNTSKCPKSSIFLRLMLFKEDFADFQGFLNTKILFLLKASVMGSQSVNYELN